MTRNLSWTLFLGLHGVLGAAFAMATMTALTWSGGLESEQLYLIGLLAAGVYLYFTATTAWEMRNGYAGFLTALESVWVKLVLFFLVPVGIAIGGTIARDGFGTEPIWGWAAGALILSPWSINGFLWILRGDMTDREDRDYIRGTKLLTLERAQRLALALPRHKNEPQIYWAGMLVPERVSAPHFVIVGPTGSGKSVTLRLLMQSILPRIRPGSDWRAVIYDPKGEFLPLLSGMPLDCPVITLHPYDQRGAAWDIARDVTDRSIALSLAATLISSPQGDNKFFYMAAQLILSAIMEAFIILAPGRWTLRDVLLVMQDSQAIKRLLLSIPQTTPTYHKYFDELHGDTLADIRATLATETTKLEPVAALWDRAKLRISLKDWARDNYILVLGKDKEIAEPLDNVNRVLFQRISQLFTKRGTGRTWIFIDEAKFAGKIPGLDDLLTTGRSFGARVCLATQDVSGLREAYGEQQAHEILGGAGNKAMLGTWNPYTAKYAAEIMGKAERIERTKSYSSGTNGSTTENERIVQRESVMPEELMDVRPANRRHFFGYYVTQAVGRYAGWLHHEKALHDAGSEPAFVSRCKEDQYLRPWGDNDRTRLGTFLADLLMPTRHGKPMPTAERASTHLDALDLPLSGVRS